MALRNQPYIPLYVQDVLTDEKLVECSAEAHGVYFRLLCIMHKSDPYGTILLKQKDKQTTEQNIKQVKNFASKLAKSMPFSEIVIENALTELVDENVLQIEGDVLSQKRMVKDNYISEQRSIAGKKGGKKTQFALAKVEANIQAKPQANSEDENEDCFSLKKKGGVGENIPDWAKKFKNYNHRAKYPSDFQNEEFAELWDDWCAYWYELEKNKGKEYEWREQRSQIHFFHNFTGGNLKRLKDYILFAQQRKWANVQSEIEELKSTSTQIKLCR
jgi:hypothetical protein